MDPPNPPDAEERPTPSAPGRLDVETLTWAALLSQCVALAQAAVALPVDSDDAEDAAEARAWSASVTHAIQLQALWFALSRSEGLPADQRALGRDRAAVSLAEHERRLQAIWAGFSTGNATGDPLPPALAELIADVRALLDAN